MKVSSFLNIIDTNEANLVQDEVEPESDSLTDEQNESEMIKRNNLGSFSSFYLPKGLKLDDPSRNKRNVLVEVIF